METQNKYWQSHHAIPDDFIDYVASEMANIMGICFDLKKLYVIFNYNNIYGKDCVCIFRDQNNSNRFVMVENPANDFVMSITVRCLLEESRIVEKKFVDTINYVLDKYGHEHIVGKENNIDDPDNSYNTVLKKLNIGFI